VTTGKEPQSSSEQSEKSETAEKPNLFAEEDYSRPKPGFRVEDEVKHDKASRRRARDEPKFEDSPPQDAEEPESKEREPPTPAKTSAIKFAIKKVQSQPALTKPNVIQSATRPAPSAPKAHQPEPRAAAERHQPEPFRRSEYSARGRPPPPPPRTGPPRREEWNSYKHGPPRDPYYDPRDPRDPRDYPYPPASRERRTHDPWESGRGRHRAPDPTSRPPTKPASSKPRRKKIVKVITLRRRIVAPPRQLPKEWAESNFIYYPKPDRNSVVGAGTYGKVFKARNVYMRRVVALKTLPLVKPRRKPAPRDNSSRDKKRKRPDKWLKDGLHVTSIREMKLLKSISHQDENIVSIREIFLEANSCNLVFDYFEFDFHGIIYSAKVGLEPSMLKDLTRQVFCGLDFLHTKAHILHRDIKAANILVSASGLVKITDFGLAKKIKAGADWDAMSWHKQKFEHSNRVITTPYRCPELLLGATLYGGEVDVWSAGCVLFEAFLKRLPFQGTGEDIDHLLTIWKVLGMPDKRAYPDLAELEWYWLIHPRAESKKSAFKKLYRNRFTPQLYHLLRCIFQHNPGKRPTAAEVLQHPFYIDEAPLPESAEPVLSSVEGEWHELEYKMIRDKEKAESRRRQEDSVILGYLRYKASDHERRLTEAVADSDADTEENRIQFYKEQFIAYEAKIRERAQLADDAEPDHAKQVAEMKKTHGDMYMDASRRSGRYRGPEREKMDEKLLGEAWRWWEDEKKKGTPLPTFAVTETRGSTFTVAASKEFDRAKRAARSPLAGEREAKKLKD
jgi:CTD kinase subunit alpha